MFFKQFYLFSLAMTMRLLPPNRLFGGRVQSVLCLSLYFYEPKKINKSHGKYSCYLIKILV